MTTKGILIASFGTSHLDTLEKTIAAVERDVAVAYPDRLCVRAFTSGMIRKALGEQGVAVQDVPGALRALLDAGVRDVAVLPTHLICGEEYDKLCQQAKTIGGFDRLHIAKPLLVSYEDVHQVLELLDEGVTRSRDEAVVLMGHGTAHWCNSIYAAMNYYAGKHELSDFFIGTVEAWPDLDTVVADVVRAGRRQIVLTPLMLVAGDHAKNDMAGQWVLQFEQAGVRVRPLLRGLGEYPGVRQMYVRRVQGVLSSAEEKGTMQL